MTKSLLFALCLLVAVAYAVPGLEDGWSRFPFCPDLNVDIVTDIYTYLESKTPCYACVDFQVSQKGSPLSALIPKVMPESYPLPLSIPVEGASLPMRPERACTNSLCLSLCRALGWPRGICLDRNTCFCWR